jgi:3-oxoacyl-[acyl-carrier-protein] synthase-3
MNAYIEAISGVLPNNVVTNSQLEIENPTWGMGNLFQKSGVYQRHIAEINETAFDLSRIAVDKLFSHSRHDLSKIDAIICCTQTPDYIMPSNSHLIHAHLKLPHSTLAFDFNLACSGFIYGLSIANSFIKSRQAKNILLVTGDTYSKLIHPMDRAVRSLFGDGVAATLISCDKDIAGFNQIDLASCGEMFNKFYVPNGGYRNRDLKNHSEAILNTENYINMDGMAVWSFINSAVPHQIKKHIQDVGWGLEEVDHFFFHQGSKLTLDSLSRTLGIGNERVHTNLVNLGNTVSASIPLCMRDAILEGKNIRLGEKILLSGFGVGLSYGTTSFIYERESYAY